MKPPSRLTSDDFRALRHELTERGELHFIIASDSMAPLIRAGDWITVRPLRNRPSVFDLLVFLQKEVLVCHYLAGRGRTREGLITRALNSGAVDLPVDAENVLGVVTSHSMALRHKLRVFWQLLRKK